MAAALTAEHRGSLPGSVSEREVKKSIVGVEERTTTRPPRKVLFGAGGAWRSSSQKGLKDGQGERLDSLL